MARTSGEDAGRAATADDESGGQAPESFTSLLAGCRFSAVHLEQRDVYTPADPDFLRWRDGDHFDPIEWGRGWIDLVAPLAARGVTGSPRPCRFRAGDRLHPVRVRGNADERRGG